MAENACRHFLGMFPNPRSTCAKGRDVRAWAIRCNGGSNHGIGLRLPCTRQSDDAEKPLFDCPELDRRTDAEVEESRAAARAQMDRLVAALPALNEVKERMISEQIEVDQITCPFCHSERSMQVSVALYINNHLRAVCSECGDGFIE